MTTTNRKPQVTFKTTSPTSGTMYLSGALVVDQWFILRDNMMRVLEMVSYEIKHIDFDLKDVTELDTFGSWRISTFQALLKDRSITSDLKNAKPYQVESITEIANFEVPESLQEGLQDPKENFIDSLGNSALKALDQFFKILSFMGFVIQSIGACFINPSQFRWRSFIKYMDLTGVKALPIIGLVSLLIGIVLVYQGVSQLERFGAEIFTVNLLAVSVLRELGILLTAIVVAGRSGSSFTAQIGFMKLNQEVDAMKVMGLQPIQILVVPRILALMIVMPLLTIYCDLVALAGGAYMSIQLIDLSFDQFLNQLQDSIQPSTFWVGLVKAPVFAFVIGLIGCYEGLRVKGGAENVGRHTTKSVVKSIFMVIVLNAFFSVVFSILKV